MKRSALLVIIGGIVTVAIGILIARYSGNGTSQLPAEHAAKRDYVGVEACTQCHRQQVDDWRGSHHDLAMQHANSDTVLGNFDDERFEYYGVRSAFSRKDGKFLVRTDGPDGKLRDYEVKYTFGVEPLQQYLVELDGGRLQALHLAWDTRPKGEGGQRWFHLYPDQKIEHTDELHWTKLAQNWNYMCAECHSTNLKKNYDLATNSFATTWSEINVACEACHGPASAHLAWADKAPGWKAQENKGFDVVFDERRGVFWQFNGSDAIAQRSARRTSVKEIETCARCHSRRSLLSENYQHGKPLLDTHLPALLTEQLYYADGQIKDEVYVYGSFLQSKMYHKGVTCSDCHEPHSTRLRAPGNRVCLQCHEPSHYDSIRHHRHSIDGAGSLCTSCHMPSKKFMVIDDRNDHSFRIPRPDLSVLTGSPNACTQCHRDQSAEWASAKLRLWFGSDWKPGWHFGEALHAGRTGAAGAGRELAALAESARYPDIVRATAASMLAGMAGSDSLASVQPLLGNPSALVRVGALQMLDAVEPAQRWLLAEKLLGDPVYAVRIEAARVLARADRDTLTPDQRVSLDRAVKEYKDAQRANAEHPQSHVNLGLLYTRLGEYPDAEAEYRQALQLDPRYIAAYVNLSDMFRVQGQEQQAGDVLVQAAQIDPGNAAVAHALGLHYVRANQGKQALQFLERAARLAPGDVRYAYVYGVALHDAGQVGDALAVLKRAHDTHPNDLDLLIALTSYSLSEGETGAARQYARKIAEIEPRLGDAGQILERFGGGR